MDKRQGPASDRSGPAGGGRFLWRRCLPWVLACAMLGTAMAWLAVVAQGCFAPLALFPLLVGVALSFLLVGVMRLGQVGNRSTVMCGAVLAVVLTVVGQHYFSYLGYIRAYRDPKLSTPLPQGSGRDLSRLFQRVMPGFPEFVQQQAERGRPLLPGYVARGWVAWASWGLDGLLVLAATLAMVIPAMRQPYCNRCRSWYRVIRSGRIDAATAVRLAEAAGLPGIECHKAARYRLMSCHAACGPTDFELAWQEADGPSSSLQVWLDADGRNRITQALDEIRNPQSDS